MRPDLSSELATRLPLTLLTALFLMPAPCIAQGHSHGHDHAPPAAPPKGERAGAVSPAGLPDSAAQRTVHGGVVVEFGIGPASTAGRTGRVLEHAENTLKLTLRDEKTGAPISGAAPAAWLDWRTTSTPTTREACRARVDGYVRANAFMESSLKSRAVVDLNSYYVLSLNRGPSISVLDPFLGFGRTRLYTTVALPSPGSSWVLAADERRLYVTLPATGQVAVVGTDRWRVTRAIATGGRPTRAVLHPGGRYLWVVVEGSDSARAPGRLVVVDTETDSIVSRLEAGRGPHALAFSDDGTVAALTNRGSGSVTLLDARERLVRAEVKTGRDPVDLAWSPAGGAMYVVHEADGTIVALDGTTGRIVTRITTRPGLRTIRVAPAAVSGHHGHGGAAAGAARRLVFALNPRENLVHVLDGATRRVIRTTEIPHGPDEVAFSGSFAYIRAAGSSDIAMIPLADPSAGGVGKLDRFPVGNQPVGAAGPLANAPTIVTAPDMPDAVYVLNAKERMIYYFHYMEGMPMPSGGLTTYGYDPTAIMVAGKDLRERQPGEYTSTVRLARQGEYDLVFMLPEPRVIACFPFSVHADPTLGAKRAVLAVEPLMDSQQLRVGTNVLRLRLSNPATREQWKDLPDATVAVATPGGWRVRAPLKATPAGAYEATLAIPAEGAYFISVEVPSLGIGLRDRQPIVMRATGTPKDG